MTHQPAISFSISLQHLLNRAGGRTSNVGRNKRHNAEAHSNRSDRSHRHVVDRAGFSHRSSATPTRCGRSDERYWDFLWIRFPNTLCRTRIAWYDSHCGMHFSCDEPWIGATSEERRATDQEVMIRVLKINKPNKCRPNRP